MSEGLKWDFAKALFCTDDTMRYDTPGDWQGDSIVAWSGLGRIEYIRGVQLHEFVEALICRAAGVTPEMMDVRDAYEAAAREYSRGELDKDQLAWIAGEYAKISIEMLDLIQSAHEKALIVERTFIEACGLDWKEYNDFIEDTRGKIPVKESPE